METAALKSCNRAHHEGAAGIVRCREEGAQSKRRQVGNPRHTLGASTLLIRTGLHRRTDPPREPTAFFGLEKEEVLQRPDPLVFAQASACKI